MKGERRRLNLSEKELLENIEWLRKKLNAFAMSKSLIDQEVINMSRILDQMLNQYYVLTNEKGSPYTLLPR